MSRENAIDRLYNAFGITLPIDPVVYTGSAGYHVGILLWNEKTNSYKRVFWSNLRDVLKEEKVVNGCPSLEIVLHGSYFERAGNDSGNDSGKARLIFKEGEYKFESHAGKVKEYK